LQWYAGRRSYFGKVFCSKIIIKKLNLKHYEKSNKNNYSINANLW
jgi:hypothetical protein